MRTANQRDNEGPSADCQGDRKIKTPVMCKVIGVWGILLFFLPTIVNLPHIADADRHAWAPLFCLPSQIGLCAVSVGVMRGRRLALGVLSGVFLFLWIVSVSFCFIESIVLGAIAVPLLGALLLGPAAYLLSKWELYGEIGEQRRLDRLRKRGTVPDC